MANSKTKSSFPLKTAPEVGHRAGLTVESLTSLPRRNNILFLSEFLHGQRAYREHYAQEGFAEIASWHRSEPVNSTLPTGHDEPSANQDESLLRTPILRARTNAAVKRPCESKQAFITDDVLRADRRNSSGVVDKGSWTREKQSAPNGSPVVPEKLPTLKPKKADSRITNPRKTGPKGGKKRKLDENKVPGDEHLERLKERRERKRARKSIMKPATDVDNETENLCRPAKKFKGGKDGDRSKTPAGLALIHGFTATNIGKKRITLEPLLRKIGVFKKGKASCVSRVATRSKRQEQHDICFSESRFLRNADAKVINSTSSSNPSDDDEAATKRRTDVRERGRESSKRLTSSRTSDNKTTFDGNSKRRSYDPDDSVVWDIERDSYVEESEIDGRQGSIVVNFLGYPLARDKETGQATMAETPMSVGVSGGPESHVLEVLPSLGASDGLEPSQSVSQLVEMEVPVEVEGRDSGCFSKYFGLPAVGHTPHKLSESNMDKSLLSPMVVASWDGRPTVQALDLSPQSPRLFETFPTFSDFTFLADQTLGFHASSDIPRATAADVTGLEHNFPLHATEVFLNSDPPLEVDMVDDLDTRSPNCDLNHTSGQPLSTADDLYLDYDCRTNDRHMDWGPVCFLYTSELCTETSDLEIGIGVSGAGDRPTISDEQSDCYMDDEEVAPDNRISPQPTVSDDMVNLPYRTSALIAEDLCSNWDSPSGSMIRVDEFSQGRLMLNGFDHSTSSRFQGISNVEAEVARLFRQNHWLPHRL